MRERHVIAISVIPTDQFPIIFYLKAQVEDKHKRLGYREKIPALCIDVQLKVTTDKFVTAQFLQCR